MRHRDRPMKTAWRAVLHLQNGHGQISVHLHEVLSPLTGVTGLRITEPILAGEREPYHLAALAHPGVQAPPEQLAKAPEGDWRPADLLCPRSPAPRLRNRLTL